MKVYAVVANFNKKVAVLLETLIVTILYQVKDTGGSRNRRQSRDGRSFDKDGFFFYNADAKHILQSFSLSNRKIKLIYFSVYGSMTDWYGRFQCILYNWCAHACDVTVNKYAAREL